MDVVDSLPPRRPGLGLTMAELRESVAAAGLPDEGMRGSFADKVKLQAATDGEVLREIAAALRGRGSEVGAAAAVVRSIAITPEAAASVCKEGVAWALADVLRQRGRQHKEPALVAWCLAAMSRLAQHQETHAQLLQAGAVAAVLAHVRRPAAATDVRTDILAAFSLAFLSQSAGGDLVSQVPLRVVLELSLLLQRRYVAHSAQQVVDARMFCGLPVDYRPRFVMQALALLLEASAAHAAVAWQTPLPELVCGVLGGSLPNDTAANQPYGSPDVVEMAGRCRKALLARAGECGGDVAPPDKVKALHSAPGAPKGTWAQRGGGRPRTSLGLPHKVAGSKL